MGDTKTFDAPSCGYVGIEAWENSEDMLLSGSSPMGSQNDKLFECVSGECNLNTIFCRDGYSLTLLAATRHPCMLSGACRESCFMSEFLRLLCISGQRQS